MNPNRFPVVGIGASAGGLEAFRLFFENLAADSGIAFVVILHLPPAQKSFLGEVLGRWTSMPVINATDGVEVEANHVYVPPPHAIVELKNGRLYIRPPADDTARLLRPIDAFFDALGTTMRDQAVGIVLSGTGTDGALGLKAIKERGGLTIVQGSDGTAPQYPDMPAGAIATGAVDLVAPVDKIPGHLLRLKQAEIVIPRESEAGNPLETARLAICDLLRSHLDHDFSGYRPQTFLRRVERRMTVTNAITLDDYIAKLKVDPGEITLLFRDLLIRVTSFFRDPTTFELLADKVLPDLFRGKQANATVRVWVPGCATGEEAYSIAILLREYMDTLPAAPKVQIFATDIDDLGIAIARAGRYPATLLDGLSEERKRRFFTSSQGGYCISREIRDLCTFSVHNLVRDPPFSMMSMVSCRNLLIYMTPELQARIIPVFHYALLPGGTLLLGGSESLAQHAGIFETVDKAARIFRRRDVRTPEIDLRWSQFRLLTLSMRGGNSNDQDAGRVLPIPVPQALGTNRSDDHTKMEHDKQIEQLLSATAPNDGIFSQLQAALAATHEQLESMTEQHQTAVEELRSTNEELHSVNEEMQSSNEELETSKEELQSLNEELHTVNLRLTEKVDELDRANSDLRNLYESSDIATVFLDRHLVVLSFTPAIANIYNLIPSDLGRPLTDIVSRVRYRGIREDVAFVLSSLEPLERRIDREDGCVHYIMRILPYRNPDSSVTGVLVTFVDVTNIVNAEAELVEADARKDVFLATLSHELRNPLAPIRTAAHLLQSPDLATGQLKEATRIIARQVTHMSSLLDDLFDVSRITRGSILLKKSYVDVDVLIDEAAEAANTLITSKQHTLRVEHPSDPIHLEVDPVRITQVITNLITNAAKYTPPGGQINVGTRLDPRHLIIFVRDNGVGLTQEAMERIFDLFSRVDCEMSRVEGGLGIGLALAKGLAELHGGRLDVQSSGANQGAEFQIYLPRSLIVDQVPASHVSDNPRGSSYPRRVLMADDNRDNADTIAMLLRISGHDVHVAYNGREALQVAARVHPDIGIVDIGMPEFNGYEVAERIRHEAWGKDVILVAFTGWGQEADKRRAIAAGFNHHLTKPVDPEELELLISNSASRTD